MSAKTKFAPCPKCGKTAASRIYFTLWGSFIGPAILCHVECGKCQTQYNGNTGRSNNMVIFVIYAILTAAIAGGLAALAMAIHSVSI